MPQTGGAASTVQYAPNSQSEVAISTGFLNLPPQSLGSVPARREDYVRNRMDQECKLYVSKRMQQTGTEFVEKCVGSLEASTSENDKSRLRQAAQQHWMTHITPHVDKWNQECAQDVSRRAALEWNEAAARLTGATRQVPAPPAPAPSNAVQTNVPGMNKEDFTRFRLQQSFQNFAQQRMERTLADFVNARLDKLPQDASAAAKSSASAAGTKAWKEAAAPLVNEFRSHPATQHQFQSAVREWNQAVANRTASAAPRMPLQPLPPANAAAQTGARRISAQLRQAFAENSRTSLAAESGQGQSAHGNALTGSPLRETPQGPLETAAVTMSGLHAAKKRRHDGNDHPAAKRRRPLPCSSCRAQVHKRQTISKNCCRQIACSRFGPAQKFRYRLEQTRRNGTKCSRQTYICIAVRT